MSTSIVINLIVFNVYDTVINEAAVRWGTSLVINLRGTLTRSNKETTRNIFTSLHVDDHT